MKRYMSVIICLIFICIICTGCDKSHKSSQNKNNSVNSNDSSKPIHNNSSITGSGESTPTPEIKDNLVVIDGEFHLNYYDLFDEYNKAHTFGNFNISEAWIDNKPYYQFTNGSIKVLCDSWGKNWFVDNGTTKKKISYKSDMFFIGAHCGIRLDLKDCLASGIPQLILIQTIASSNTQTESIYIYNIDTLNEYKSEDYSKKLYNFAKISIEKNKINTKKNSNSEIDLNYFSYFDTTNEGKLFVTHLVNSDPNTILGKITGELTFDGSKIVIKDHSLKFTKNSK